MTELMKKFEQKFMGVTIRPPDPFRIIEVERLDTKQISDPPYTNRVRYSVTFGREVLYEGEQLPEPLLQQLRYSLIEELYGEFRDDLITASIYMEEGKNIDAIEKLHEIYHKMFD